MSGMAGLNFKAGGRSTSVQSLYRTAFGGGAGTALPSWHARALSATGPILPCTVQMVFRSARAHRESTRSLARTRAQEWNAVGDPWNWRVLSVDARSPSAPPVTRSGPIDLADADRDVAEPAFGFDVRPEKAGSRLAAQVAGFEPGVERARRETPPSAPLRGSALTARSEMETTRMKYIRPGR